MRAMPVYGVYCGICASRGLYHSLKTCRSSYKSATRKLLNIIYIHIQAGKSKSVEK